MRTAQECPRTGHDLLHIEGFGKIVVRAAIQATRRKSFSVFAGQDQDGTFSIDTFGVCFCRRPPVEVGKIEV